jgi:hypothetical protein
MANSLRTLYLCHSIRRALMGSINAARLPGIIAAKKAQIASEAIAINSASGSQASTP